MKILIVGGGMAGLTLAAFLKKFNVGKVVLIEQAPQFGTIGFVIGLWGNGRRILKELSLDHLVVEKNGYEFNWHAVEDSQGHLVKNFNIHPFEKFGATSIVSRTDLHNGLVKAAEGTEIRFNTKVEGLKQEGDTVRVSFNDDKTEEFDLVIGADGVKSSIREKVFGKNYLNYYGWGVWVYWLPEGFSHPSQVIAFLGKGKFYSIFPLYERSVVWFVSKVSKDYARDPLNRGKLLKNEFADFEGPIKSILDAMPESERIFYDDLCRVQMTSWYKGRVVLMGDAQHAVSPISGMGSSMAMEDAYVLADELRKITDTKHVGVALKAYAKRRQKRVIDYHKITDRLDRWMMLGGVLSSIRNLLLPIVPNFFFTGPIKRLLEKDI